MNWENEVEITDEPLMVFDSPEKEAEFMRMRAIIQAEYEAEDKEAALNPVRHRNKVNYPMGGRDLGVAFADDLPTTFEPLDELVQGLLTADGGSVLYGASNSGKTFAVIDIACAVARGVPWMGRRTEAGMVLYLAAESPSSVRSRMQAYQQHHGVRVPNFAIIQNPIDLFAGDADTDAVITLVHDLEEARGDKVRLIVGDTLARLSAGANENAGQDMGVVVRNLDRIRASCGAHLMLVHHSGKDATAGARGWSGLKAAMDTEIEVTDSVGGRCAEITKQRDLSTKGERIGFQLIPVSLGTTRWGSPATSCVVAPADAPKRKSSKRVNKVRQAIVDFLRAQDGPVTKIAMIAHFKGTYDRKFSLYRELKVLVESGMVEQDKETGMVKFTKGFGTAGSD